MKATQWKCRFILDGVHYECRIYEDSEGDWFIHHMERYWNYENFAEDHYVSRWEE